MTKARDLANAGTALTSVSATELGYLDGVTSAVQTQIDAKLATSTASTTYQSLANNNAAGKNAVINGGMDIWQRGTSIAIPGTSTITYTADRWMNARSATGQTVSRQVTGDTTNLPNIQYCARVQRDSGNTGTTVVRFFTSLETINSIPFAGKTITVSWYARAGANYSSASSNLVCEVTSGTGTDQNILAGFTGSSTFIGTNNTLTTTWQRFTATGTVATTATELGLGFYFTPVGTAGANDYFEITGVQLEVGSTATAFSRAGGTIQGELAACQRYYWRTTSGGGYVRLPMGSAQSTTQVNIPLINPVTMRTTPTTLDYSTLGGTGLVVTDYITNTTPSTFVLDSTYASSPVISYLTATVASGLTAFRPYTIGFNSSTTGYIGISAEL